MRGGGAAFGKFVDEERGSEDSDDTLRGTAFGEEGATTARGSVDVLKAGLLRPCDMAGKRDEAKARRVRCGDVTWDGSGDRWRLKNSQSFCRVFQTDVTRVLNQALRQDPGKRQNPKPDVETEAIPRACHQVPGVGRLDFEETSREMHYWQPEDMFSRCNHHDQKGPAHNPVPSTQPASPSLAGEFLPHSDHLSAHYSRLESPLDSALATLTLIRDSSPSTALPAFTGHMTEVLHTLCRHAPLAPSLDTLGPTVPPPPTPTPVPKSATYAPVTACTAADHVEPLTVTNAPQSHSKRAERQPQSPDLVFRFDRFPFIRPPLKFRPHPAQMYIAIKEKSISGDLSLPSIRWTTKGNLTFTFRHDEKFTPAGAMALAPAIWALIRPQFKLPKNHPGHRYEPHADHGSHWHTVVIHAVPICPITNPNPTIGDGPDAIREETVSAARGWLRDIDIKDASLMCSDTDLPTRQSAPLRLSLAHREDADSLIQNGALVLGSRCRVSQYVAKPPS
ncbi:hypothetical protein DFH08DRAFT_822326 [Mycena albidolilacea]|uniref:Uncharacterized protein n=1 Tax=Mycena albidolilacea TaxID=1033008 RepID=A0AAD7ED84_9AGAR|nr:hypothetical protein DFH08DRAFT_822326 [Mycena albidolilacea]